MKKLKNLTLLILFSFQFGCAGLFTNRTFVDEMEHDTDGFFVAGEDFPVTSGDSGQIYRTREDIMKRTPASARSHKELLYYNALKTELAKKESKLGPDEYRYYLENRDYFDSDSERIYYLGLTPEERSAYLDSKKMTFSQQEHRMDPSYDPDRGTGIAILDQGVNYESQEGLALGMEKNEVIGIWGRPHRVDVAGDPRYQNERWSFVESGRRKTVYFEQGRVQGWAID